MKKDLNADYELQRAQQIQAMKKKMADYDQQLKAATTDFFNIKTGLNQAIQEEILPCLVSLKTTRVSGIGFYQHTDWLVTNAHIIPRKEVCDHLLLSPIQAGSNLETPIEYRKSYHRPYGKPGTPDVVIIQTTTANRKALPTQFTDDEVGYQGSYLFYVDVDALSNELKINFLNQTSAPGELPIRYECTDKSIPQPGSSGTPIIEARILKAKEPIWQFRVVAVLYARCSERSKIDSKFVCAIPVLPDFKQLLPAIQLMQSSSRYTLMAKASSSIPDLKGKQDAAHFNQESLKAGKAASSLFSEFEEGKTELDISLPPNLEPLWYSGIVKIEHSLLITKVRKIELGKSFKRFDKVPDVSLQDLQSDFKSLVHSILSEKTIKLAPGDRFRESEHFRIDVGFGGKSGEFWMLDIQDNTGKFQLSGKSLSSVFAKIRIKRNLTEISGSDLGALFDKSQKDQKVYDHNPQPTNTSSKKSETKAKKLSIKM